MQVEPMDRRISPDDEVFLRQTDWLSRFSKPTAEAILDHCTIRNFQHGQRVHSKGDESSGILAILDGGIRYTATTASGYETSFCLAVPGDWAGDLSTIADFGRTHDGYAVGSLRFALLSSAAVQQIGTQYKDFYPALIKNLCLSMRESFDEIDKILSSTPEQLLAWRICDFCVQASGKSAMMFTQQDLAALIGVSRQSVNKILQKWSRQGIVELRYGKLKLLDHNRLADMFE